MNYNDVRKNENKGFSLVELIVVIAIMAVLTAVLAPTLLQYVERSRAQKDDSAMGEVTNAFMLALSDQDVYDELLNYNLSNNKSCYADSDHDDASDAFLGEDARAKNEEIYTLVGTMRGVTVTFEPSVSANKSTYTIAAGKVNREAASDAAKGTVGTINSGSNTNSYLYNRVRNIVGDTIELSSQTYRNSEYTVFIKMGTLGGDMQEAISVYGQWGGTNISKADAEIKYNDVGVIDPFSM
jgi:prepilin-type N-terminal cleavage/methylation domain-containing protein